jgi:hypothetical protein
MRHGSGRSLSGRLCFVTEPVKNMTSLGCDQRTAGTREPRRMTDVVHTALKEPGREEPGATTVYRFWADLVENPCLMEVHHASCPFVRGRRRESAVIWPV